MCKKRVLVLFVLLVLSAALYSQEFGGIYDNLNRLQDIIQSEIDLNESMQRDNESLKSAMNTLSELLTAQGKLLNEQERNYNNQREISGKQAQLLGRYISRSKRLRIGLIIGVPAGAAAGVLMGWMLWAVKDKQRAPPF